MLENLIDSLNLLIIQTKTHFDFLINCVAILVISYLLSVITQRRLLYLGIIPRHLSGLKGIIFSPILHADFNHLFSNLIPFLVLANFILLQGIPFFLNLSLYITIVSGLFIWCFAKSGIYVGASAVITGYWGYLIVNAFYEKTILTFFLAAICIYYFAGIFIGLFPSRQRVSWEGHLFGLIAGISAYFIF